MRGWELLKAAEEAVTGMIVVGAEIRCEVGHDQPPHVDLRLYLDRVDMTIAAALGSLARRFAAHGLTLDPAYPGHPEQAWSGVALLRYHVLADGSVYPVR